MLKCDYKCYNLCNIPVCWGEKVDIDLPMSASISGDYVISYTFLESSSNATKNFEAGDNLSFNLCLNENQCYCVTITDPNGDIVTYIEDDVEYHCFKFCTNLSVNTDC